MTDRDDAQLNGKSDEYKFGVLFERTSNTNRDMEVFKSQMAERDKSVDIKFLGVNHDIKSLGSDLRNYVDGVATRIETALGAQTAELKPLLQHKTGEAAVAENKKDARDRWVSLLVIGSSMAGIMAVLGSALTIGGDILVKEYFHPLSPISTTAPFRTGDGQ